MVSAGAVKQSSGGVVRYRILSSVTEANVRIVNNDLTTQQKSRLRRAYRDTFNAADPGIAVRELYAKYSELFGVPTHVLQGVVADDLRRNGEQYASLHQSLAARQAADAKSAINPELGQLDEQVVIAAYRETFAEPNRFAAYDRFLSNLSEAYGTTPRVLKDIVALDEKRNADVYRALRGDFAPQDEKLPRMDKAPRKTKRSSGQLPVTPADAVKPPTARVPKPKPKANAKGEQKAKGEAKAKGGKRRKVGRLAVCTGKHTPWEYCSACEGHDRNVKESNHSVRFEEKRGATRIVRGGLPGLGRRS